MLARESPCVWPEERDYDLSLLLANETVARITSYYATMTQWLRSTTAFQRVALALMVLPVGTVAVSYFHGGTSASGFLALAFIVGYIAFRKELL